MAELLRVSGKDLGAIALDDFCPRCYWVRRHAPNGLPFQIFPGIFSSILALIYAEPQATPEDATPRRACRNVKTASR